MSSSILKEINKEVQDFQTKQIQIVPNLLFNQYETLQQIYFYYNSKYKTGEVDSDGDRKYFHNINRNPCKVGSKSIDFDTKNIRLVFRSNENEASLVWDLVDGKLANNTNKAVKKNVENSVALS